MYIFVLFDLKEKDWLNLFDSESSQKMCWW